MRLRFPALAGLAFAALLLAPAADAAHDPDWEGWFFQLDAAMVTPGNTDTPVIAAGPDIFSGVAADSHVEWMDWDDDVAFRVGVGYSLGTKGSLRVSYWSYDDTADSDGSIYSYAGGPQYVWWTVGPLTNIYYTYSYETLWDFEQEIEAETWDIEWSRTAQIGNPFQVTYGVGLRYASYEETVDGRYTVDPLGVGPFLPGPNRFPAERSIDSDGFGFTGSVGANYDFSDFFGIGSNIRVGFLTSDVDLEHSVQDLDGYGVPAGDSFREEASFEDEVAMTVDFDFSLLFHTGPYLDVDVGFFYSRWSDLPEFNLTRQHNAIIPAPSILDESRDHISWSGAQVKLRFHI